jgi:WD40 repeat protein
LAGIRRIQIVRVPPASALVAVMTLPASSKHASGSQAIDPARQLLKAVVYRFDPGTPPRALHPPQTCQLAEVSHDGKYLLTLTPDDNLERTSLDSGKPTPIGLNGTPVLFALSPAVPSMAVAMAADEIQLREIDSGGLLPFQPSPPTAGLPAQNAPSAMSFSPDGKWLLVTGTEIQILPPHLQSIALINTQSATTPYQAFGRDAFFTDDGRMLVWWDPTGVTLVNCENDAATAGTRISVPVADLRPAKRGTPADLPEPVSRPVQVDAQGRRLLVLEPADNSATAGMRASLWDVETGERLRRILAPTSALAAAGLDATGRFALTQVNSKRPELLLWPLDAPDAPCPRVAELPVAPASSNDLVLTRHPLIATIGRQGEWSLIDPAIFKPVGPPIRALDPATNWVVNAEATVLVQITLDGGIYPWDLKAGKPAPSSSLGTTPLNVAAISPDGRLLAIAAFDRLVVRPVVGGDTRTTELRPSLNRPTCIRFSENGRQVAIADESGRVIIHSIEPAGSSVTLETQRPVHEIAFCLSDSMLITAHTGGQAGLWSLKDKRRVASIEPGDGRQGVGAYSPPNLPTRIAVRDEAVGAAPPLLATAIGNIIELRPLPGPDETGLDAKPLPLGARLETTHGVLAMAFPPCKDRAGASTLPAGTQPGAGDAPRPCERLLVITDKAAVRWFDVSVRPLTPEQWLEQTAARTALSLNAQGEPVVNP